ncbi:dethiobiotin synthase [Acetobacter estunensis]|uniref:dethiobiotin synthase n=1 Tax=Acetobacter estunensis TaxID=104097 RepID=UPI001C2D337B|nr:dethiobiotin synthase [Acetobacter estunensis]MBV1837612.1 dethiobiotin synthase [Acetobacter estunensis]
MVIPNHHQTAQDRALIAQRFDRAQDYDGAAAVQRVTGRALMERIRVAQDGREVRRILEFGCGTGFFTSLLRAMWPEAEIVATDLSVAMLRRAAERGLHNVTFIRMDAADPDGNAEVTGAFDLICGNLAVQWVEPPEQALAALAKRLAPGGLLAVSTLAGDSFHEWRAAHDMSDCVPAIRRYPSRDQLRNGWPCGRLATQWSFETLVERTNGGMAFLRGLKQIGATEQDARNTSGHLSPGHLRSVVRAFDRAGAVLTWDLAFGLFRVPPRAGVFVTGTDTGVGKTFVSACLTQAWDALYWKTLQTGLSDEAGDTPEVIRLAKVSADRIVPPAATFLAPLSPEAAAEKEGCSVDMSALRLPMEQPERPLVVEGAGGLDVPVTEDTMMIDLAERFGLPVVLVARSGLGTLNHTLLSLEALRRRGMVVAGVVLNGSPNAGNRDAIERHGKVRVLAEIPVFCEATPEIVADVARSFPAWSAIAGQTQ